jgi:GNAT superfamily N-acetyltransferase
MMSKTVVHIRPIAETDVARLERRFPQGGVAKHAERFVRQQRGDATYLIAWHKGHPVGHALLNYGGSRDEHVAKQSKFACPDLEDLFVLAERRSQGIGSQLVAFAERLASEHGYSYLGISVAAEANDAARRLYEHLGYRDAHFGEYLERGEYVDLEGQRHTWEELCIYLIKDLGRADVPEK